MGVGNKARGTESDKMNSMNESRVIASGIKKPAQARRWAELVRELDAIPYVTKISETDGAPCQVPANVDRWNAIKAEMRALYPDGMTQEDVNEAYATLGASTIETTAKTLSHNQQIRVAGFRFQKKISVVTHRGLFDVEKYGAGKTWEAYDAQARENCKKSYCRFKPAWASQAGSMLTANYPGKAEAMEKARQEWAAAVEIASGELVLIEGVEYRVRVNGESYSDPVDFILATDWK